MSALHQAVARAIRDTCHGAQGGPLPVHNDQRWPDPRRPDCQTCNEAAATAVGVVLAEAKRSIEALPEGLRKGDVRRAEALAVLVALGEQGCALDKANP